MGNVDYACMYAYAHTPTLTAFFATRVCGRTTTMKGIPRLRQASAAPSNPPPFPAPALIERGRQGVCGYQRGPNQFATHDKLWESRFENGHVPTHRPPSYKKRQGLTRGSGRGNLFTNNRLLTSLKRKTEVSTSPGPPPHQPPPLRLEPFGNPFPFLRFFRWWGRGEGLTEGKGSTKISGAPRLQRKQLVVGE